MPLEASSNTVRKRASVVRSHDVGLAREQQRAHRGDEHRRIDRMREIAVTAGGQALLMIVVGDEGRRQVHDG